MSIEVHKDDLKDFCEAVQRDGFEEERIENYRIFKRLVYTNERKRRSIVMVYKSGKIVPQGLLDEHAKTIVEKHSDRLNLLRKFYGHYPFFVNGDVGRDVFKIRMEEIQEFNLEKLIVTIQSTDDHDIFCNELGMAFWLLGFEVRKYRKEVRAQPDLLLFCPYSIPPYAVVVECKTGRGKVRYRDVAQTVGKSGWLREKYPNYNKYLTIITNRPDLEIDAKREAKGTIVIFQAKSISIFFQMCFEQRITAPLLENIFKPRENPIVTPEALTKTLRSIII